MSLPMYQSGDSGGTVHKILTERKCWRVAKNKDGVVWPPDLEAALIEGLEKYEPRQLRTTRGFGRFPNRNKFISYHILRITGRYRTPKQVGSRIQQLRDTDAGKALLRKMCDKHAESSSPAAHGSLTDVINTHTFLSTNSLINSLSRYNQVIINILPADSAWPRLGCPLDESSMLYPSETMGIFYSTPRPLRIVDPTITFASSTSISAYSCFRVFQGETIVHIENTPLTLRQFDHHGVDTILYSTMLVPEFWNQLCTSKDPTSYTILQEIMPISDPSMTYSRRFETLFVVLYRFSQGLSSPPISKSSEFNLNTPEGYLPISDPGPPTDSGYIQLNQYSVFAPSETINDVTAAGFDEHEFFNNMILPYREITGVIDALPDPSLSTYGSDLLNLRHVGSHPGNVVDKFAL